MSTPHNNAAPGQIAKTLLMPGDPLRAKFIAETFLQNPVCFNEVRGMLGFTGSYHGRPVSVMGSGMGMPSIGIYSYELYTVYGVENIIRIGSAGSYCEEAKIYDVLLASSAWSESSYARVQGGFMGDTLLPSAPLCQKIAETAAALSIPLKTGPVHSSDVFYREDHSPYYQRLHEEKGVLCVEMESFALFHNAQACGKNAACLLTISDSFVSHEETTAAERQSSFTAMMKIALETAASL
ncbi:MAG: purine-nucleoside phosphorylase [Provencibacterium sp.]|jgi:purine-nucleoside phosphorylase|nr:purine-nucleoside phosphorylase [Provencibacterium sp.]